MLWPVARTGNTDGIIARAWMLLLWPIARNGITEGMDALASRTGWQQGRNHRAGMWFSVHRAPKNTVKTDVAGVSWSIALALSMCRACAPICVGPALLDVPTSVVAVFSVLDAFPPQPSNRVGHGSFRSPSAHRAAEG